MPLPASAGQARMLHQIGVARAGTAGTRWVPGGDRAGTDRWHGSHPPRGGGSLARRIHERRGAARMSRHDDHQHHDHDHDHDHDHGSELSPMDLRVRALQSLLTAKGYIDPAALDRIVDTYETRVGPRNGAAVVARAWTDPTFLEWLRRDASAAIGSMGFTGRQGEHMVVVENTPDTHNMVVCTLCSCYPW